jgi:hypothetical protein
MKDEKFYRMMLKTRDQQQCKGQEGSDESVWLCPDNGIVFHKAPGGEDRFYHISNIPGSDWWVVPFNGKKEYKTFEVLIGK